MSRSFFAPGEFIKMSDDNKLARDSFQKFNGGARLSGTNQRKTDHYVRKKIRYERKIVDAPDEQKDEIEDIPEGVFGWELMLSSAAVSAQSSSEWPVPADAPAPLTVETAKYKVKSIDDLSDHTTTEFENEWSAMQYIQEQEVADPALEQTLTVISTLEEE